MKRRYFLSQTSKIGGGLALMNALPVSSILGKTTTIAPSDKIRVGLIGCKGMGFSDLKSILKMPEIDCIGLCDVDANVLTERQSDVEKLRGTKPKGYGIIVSYWKTKI